MPAALWLWLSGGLALCPQTFLGGTPQACCPSAWLTGEGGPLFLPSAGDNA